MEHDETDAILEGRIRVEGFPFYYPMDGQFQNANGDPSGDAGATAELSKTITTFPHLLYGLRIRNVYPLPSIEDNNDFVANKRLDADQTVEIKLSQQNITAGGVLQDHITGGGQGITAHWHPFPKPYLMAGGNEILIFVRRITSYIPLNGGDVEPRCFATLVTQILRGDRRTVPPHRRER